MIRKNIEELIEYQPSTMSKYQINNFVIGDKITLTKKLKQILLELNSRYTNYDILQIDLKEIVLKHKKLQRKLKKFQDSNEYKFELIQCKLERLEIKKRSLLKTINNTAFEIEVFEKDYETIFTDIDNLKSLLDDEMNEQDYWNNKFIKEAQIDIMTTGRIGKGVLDAIMVLSNENQSFIINNAVGQAALANNSIHSIEVSTLKQIKEHTP